MGRWLPAPAAGGRRRYLPACTEAWRRQKVCPSVGDFVRSAGCCLCAAKKDLQATRLPRRPSRPARSNKWVSLVPRGPYAPPPSNPTTPAVFLYAWSGNDNPGRSCRDALVVVDATPESPYFGQIVNVAFTPTWGNEPHHVSWAGAGLLAAKQWAAGGSTSTRCDAAALACCIPAAQAAAIGLLNQTSPHHRDFLRRWA